MAESTEDNTDLYFTKLAQHLIKVHDDKHAEWVLFRHGSLFLQTMSNNEETSTDELIKKAKESLENVIIGPGSCFGDAVISRYDYENDTVYYSSIETFNGIILVYPSREVHNDIIAMHIARTNILNDQQNPVVIATGNTKQKLN